MNTLIDDKLYELVTKIENFEVAYDISQRIKFYEDRLREEFLKELLKKIKNEHQELESTEIIENKFFINRRDWNTLEFCCEIDSNKFYISIGQFKKVKSSTTRSAIIKKILDSYNLEHYINENEPEHWLFTSSDHDFSKLEGLKVILPDNRDKIISEYYELFKKMYDIVLKVANEYEKNK
jgi:hypothetical protein